MKKQVMMLGLSVLLCGCGGKSVEKEGTGTYTNDSGEKTTARVKLKNDKIAEVEIDETAKGKDKTKKELGEDQPVPYQAFDGFAAADRKNGLPSAGGHHRHGCGDFHCAARAERCVERGARNHA